MSTLSFYCLVAFIFAAIDVASATQPADGTLYPLPVSPWPNHYVPGTVATLAPGTNTTTQIVLHFQKMLAKGDIPSGALWLTKANGEQLLFSLGGQSLDEGSEPFRLDNYLRIGSITKTFTGSAILQLVQQGKISLDDTWSKFYDPSLGEFPYADNITIRHMLSMTTGIPEYIKKGNGYDPEVKTAPYNWTYEDTVRLILDREPLFPPGQSPSNTFNYTNSNFVLLGQRVIEKVTNQPWRDFFLNEVIKPAGLGQTLVPAVGEVTVPQPSPTFYAYRDYNLTDPTTADDHKVLIDYSDIDPSTWGAAGSFVSTFQDLHLWARYLTTGQGLSPELRAERFEKNNHVAPFALPPGIDFSYGLGVMKINNYFGHIGDAVGASTYMFHDPAKNNTMICVASNGPSRINVADAIALLAMFDPEGFSGLGSA
ncbi:beta-lactamase/transpeptidase-like protein [Auriculariales sp. MPI-PUGE-AT-0066]|nr:beta-lactamase/transpeptidase-like protein [Auriculariales sp. MPI-PUGE-AT-0066]